MAQVTIALVVALVALVALVTFALAIRPVWWVWQVLMVDEGPPAMACWAAENTQGEPADTVYLPNIVIYTI